MSAYKKRRQTQEEIAKTKYDVDESVINENMQDNTKNKVEMNVIENDEPVKNTPERDELISLLTSIKEHQEFMEKKAVEQDKKIQEQEAKINDIINTATNLIQNPQAIAPLLQKVVGGNVMQGQEGTSNIDDTEASPEAKNNQVDNEAQKQALLEQAKANALKTVATSNGIAPKLNLDSISQLAQAIAVITSNIGGGRRETASPSSVIDNITGSVQLASQIAGALGTGLGNLFEGFNNMQERAFKAWHVRAAKEKLGIDKNTLKEALKDIMLEINNSSEVNE